jgi:hypothetical protein
MRKQEQNGYNLTAEEHYFGNTVTFTAGWRNTKGDCTTHLWSPQELESKVPEAQQQRPASPPAYRVEDFTPIILGQVYVV